MIGKHVAVQAYLQKVEVSHHTLNLGDLLAMPEAP